MPNEVPAAWSGDLRIIRHALGNRVAGFVPWSSWSFQSLKKNSGNLSIFEKFVVWTVTSNVVARSAPSFARRPVDSFLLPGSGYHGFPLKRQAWYLWPYPGIRKKLVQTVQQHMSHSTLQKPWTIEFGYFLLLYSTLTKSHCWIELHKQLDFKWYVQILHKVMCVCVFFFKMIPLMNSLPVWHCIGFVFHNSAANIFNGWITCPSLDTNCEA